MRTIEELVSREQVLAGEMELTLQDKAGDAVTLKLKALRRSELMTLMRQHPTDWDAKLLDRCSDDATVLDGLDMGSLAEAQKAAGALCMGLPEAKKREEATNQLAAAMASLNLNEPPVNSAPTVGPAPISPASPSGS